MTDTNFYSISFSFNDASSAPLYFKLAMLTQLKTYLDEYPGIRLEDEEPVTAEEMLGPILKREKGIHDDYGETVIFAHLDSTQVADIQGMGFEVDGLRDSESYYLTHDLG